MDKQLILVFLVFVTLSPIFAADYLVDSELGNDAVTGTSADSGKDN